VPIGNALNALGRVEEAQSLRLRRMRVLDEHLHEVPDDARARILLASDYAVERRAEEAMRELQLAIALRPDDASMLYNATCVLCGLERKSEALAMIEKAWTAGYRDTNWARRDPDLALLRGDPVFERLYPEAQPND
jgi:Tfp pilus assembly protein PilF